jgi:hypothetical protein
MSDLSVSQFAIVRPLWYICINNNERGKKMFVSEDGIIEYDDPDCLTCDNWGCDDCVGP